MARFIVAPSGYGKTFLALEYAETVHSWANVFWFNSQSPCFVRDLDAGVLVDSCLALDPKASLVVFDDVPLFDVARQKALSSEIDKLLARNCEVMVTCLPTCDISNSLQRDRLRVRARSLLLDDEELDANRSLDERERQPAEQVGCAERVPLLACAADSGVGRRFVQGALREEMPADLLLAMVSMFVLCEGGFDELRPFISAGTLPLIDMQDDYPHFGIDSDSERFDAPSIDVKALVAPVKSCLSRLAAHSPFSSSSALVVAWSSALLLDGNPARACSVMGELGSRRNRATWLADNAVELFRKACFFPVMRLTAGKDGVAGALRMRQEAVEALCRRLLGDEEGAIRIARRNAFNDSAPEDVRVLSLLIVSRLDVPATAGRASKTLCDLAENTGEGDIESRSAWNILAQAWCIRSRGLANLADFWVELLDSGASYEVLCLCASWMFGMFEEPGESLPSDTALALRRAERYVREQLLRCGAENVTDYYIVSAGLSMEEAHTRGMELEGGSLEASSLVILRHVEMEILAQRRLFDEDKRLEQMRRGDWVATHPASMLNRENASPMVTSARSVPVLSLRMFGSFEVSIGDAPLEYSLFKRHNTRVLLVMLAVNQGREISREAASEALWPRSSSAVAHKNFYTVWSDLRHALALPDGTCPYLIRHRYGCSLDQRFVHSDVDRYSEICREFLFGVPNIEHWSLLFAEIDRDFPSDFMPSERKNAVIIKARDDYRARLVDALVTATGGAIDAGNPQWGVWFARAAIARDETREDAYVALMRAQIAGNQRTAAMMTYLSCRRALSDNLGIDPAPETTALYEGLLDSD